MPTPARPRRRGSWLNAADGDGLCASGVREQEMAVSLVNARLDAAAIAQAANAFSLPAAIVCNAHITGLAVARSLAAQGVPVIGLDRDPAGVALASNALVAAAVCHDPIGAAAEFIADL